MKIEDFNTDLDNITEEQLNAIYMFISMTFDDMKDEEKDMWYNILKKIDKQFDGQD